MNNYKVLKAQTFQKENFKIVPIRFEDRWDIMQWRNEQIYHLRQVKPLTEAEQENYFRTVVSELFHLEKPTQLLFSYLTNDECIGYGGLVHINWTDKHAEISFIMNTALEKDYFEFHWGNFLELIEKVAFKELNLRKIFVYAFDLRPHLYEAIKLKQFELEARLEDHCFFDGKYIDVVIYKKINA